MGFFKSKEEKEAERKQREEERAKIEQAVRESDLTKQLQITLWELFGDLDGERVQKLRQLALEGRNAGCILRVFHDGILLDWVDRKGESIEREGLTFDELGYENLPGPGVAALNEMLLIALKAVPHLHVYDTGHFRYEKNRPKQSW